MRPPIRWTVVPILVVVLAGSAAAQAPDERRGFWIGFGLGGGHLGRGDCPEEALNLGFGALDDTTQRWCSRWLD